MILKNVFSKIEIIKTELMLPYAIKYQRGNWAKLDKTLEVVKQSKNCPWLIEIKIN